MAMKLNMLPPSVNNMSVRVFVRAAGIPVEEENVWGQTQGDEYLSKYPPGLTPTIEDDELPKGVHHVLVLGHRDLQTLGRNLLRFSWSLGHSCEVSAWMRWIAPG